MRTISLYGHVIELLEMLESSREPADQLAGRFLRERRYLGSRDRRFISELYFDVLRNRALLEFHARNALSAAQDSRGLPQVSHIDEADASPAPHAAPQAAPQVRHLGDALGGLGGREQVGQGAKWTAFRGIPPIALITAHQLHIAREDPSALVPDVADLWRMAGAAGDISGLVEAIRTSSIPDSVLSDPTARLSLQYSIAGEIVREWIERFGEAAAEKLCQASNTPAPTTIRVNTLKCTREECRAALAREGVSAAPTRFSPVGLILEKRVNTGALESYRSGMFEMQDEGSQIISMLLDPEPGSVVVDACAGAGGKSLHVAALMKGEGKILALDSDPVRLRSLRTRALRSGTDIIRDALVPADAGPDPGLDGVADAVLIDAPCSGIGTYRRNPGAKAGFSVGTSATLSLLQSSLLERYHQAVKPGGRLVYATCTLLRRENEEVVERFLQNHRDFYPVSAAPFLAALGIPQTYPPSMLLLPHETSTDGFFAAVLERSGGND